MAHYLDTSALARLITLQAETDALRAWIQEADGEMVTCDLTRTELTRAVRRHVPDRAVQARAVLDALTILTLPPAVFETAARLEPPELRSLDAVHLAAALDLGDDLDGFVAYDARLLDAARRYGMTTLSPGAEQEE